MKGHEKMKLTEYVTRLGSFRTNPRWGNNGRSYMSPRQIAILNRLRKSPSTPKEIATELNMPLERVQVAMSRMKSRGLVKITAWYPTDCHAGAPTGYWEAVK